MHIAQCHFGLYLTKFHAHEFLFCLSHTHNIALAICQNVLYSPPLSPLQSQVEMYIASYIVSLIATYYSTLTFSSTNLIICPATRLYNVIHMAIISEFFIPHDHAEFCFHVTIYSPVMLLP